MLCLLVISLVKLIEVACIAKGKLKLLFLIISCLIGKRLFEKNRRGAFVSEIKTYCPKLLS